MTLSNLRYGLLTNRLKRKSLWFTSGWRMALTLTFLAGIFPVARVAASTASAVNEKFIGVVTLPTSYNAAPDGYPIGLYWALHNQLSTYVGLDLTSQLGHELKIYFEGHDVILKDFQGHVVGKWRSTGRDLSDATTTGKSFQTVTGMSLNRWIETHQPVVPSKRLKMSPEEAIRLFYSAINSYNEALAMSYVDPVYKYQFMRLDVNPHGLYQPTWTVQTDITRPFKRIKVLNISEIITHNPYLHYIVPTKFFVVKTWGQYDGFTYPNGINNWVVAMVKPTSSSPWMFNGTPTGGY